MPFPSFHWPYECNIGGSATEDGIVYGSVNAPNFVPFLGAFVVIAFAGIQLDHCHLHMGLPSSFENAHENLSHHLQTVSHDGNLYDFIALPALLSSGEKALEQQRIDEQTKGNEFGRGDSVGRRNEDV